MHRFRLATLTAFFLLLYHFGGKASIPPANRLDYWEKSSSLWSQIRNDRKIIVSAQNGNGQTYSKGVGLVRADMHQVWEFATNPEKIKTASRFIKSFSWDQKSGKVDILFELMSISHRLQGKAMKIPDQQNPRIQLQVLEGSLVPFTAVLELRSAQAQRQRSGAPDFPDHQTLVKLSGVSAPDRSLSWPLRVAVEALLQRTAGALRDAVENEPVVAAKEKL